MSLHSFNCATEKVPTAADPDPLTQQLGKRPQNKIKQCSARVRILSKLTMSLRSKRRHSPRSDRDRGERKRRRNESDEDSEADDDVSGGSREDLHSIGYYVDDRAEMIEQIFSVIRGPKLKAMLTSTLRDIPVSELKSLCLEQLEGMSRKRIRYILAGKEMEDSSATEDDDDDEEERPETMVLARKEPERYE